MHLADATYSAFGLYISFCQYMCFLGIEPTTFALLTQCSTTEPQEHWNLYIYIYILYIYTVFTPQTNSKNMENSNRWTDAEVQALLHPPLDDISK